MTVAAISRLDVIAQAQRREGYLRLRAPCVSGGALAELVWEHRQVAPQGGGVELWRNSKLLRVQVAPQGGGGELKRNSTLLRVQGIQGAGLRAQ